MLTFLFILKTKSKNKWTEIELSKNNIQPQTLHFFFINIVRVVLTGTHYFF
jgi:hypothetical protein